MRCPKTEAVRISQLHVNDFIVNHGGIFKLTKLRAEKEDEQYMVDESVKATSAGMVRNFCWKFVRNFPGMKCEVSKSHRRGFTVQSNEHALWVRLVRR